jgi:hypothetical protein
MASRAESLEGSEAKDAWAAVCAWIVRGPVTGAAERAHTGYERAVCPGESPEAHKLIEINDGRESAKHPSMATAHSALDRR